MKAWPVQPGVPAMGHVTASGFWHPGAVQGCKCNPRPVAPAGYEHRPREAARLGFRPPR